MFVARTVFVIVQWLALILEKSISNKYPANISESVEGS